MEEKTGLVQVATDLLAACSGVEDECRSASANTELWSSPFFYGSAARSKALGLLDRLQVLLLGPHDYLHEFVAPNWDHGALYAVLQSPVLEAIQATREGQARVTELAKESGIPSDKLVRILRLLCCRHFLHEPEEGVFALTSVSEELLRDRDFRSWVEFQLFETRVASAHLAAAILSKPNRYYADGTSGFRQGWGMEMYEWHQVHPDKGERFRRAMRGVSQSLDPADSLIRTWIQQNPEPSRTHFVELGGRYGFASTSLVAEFPDLSFEIRCESPEFLHHGQALVPLEAQARIIFNQVPSIFAAPPPDSKPLVYLIRNFLWNWTDEDAIRLIQTLIPSLQATSSTRILVTDGMSPGMGDFPAHVEVGFRRRDITTMTMHNVKQRSQHEWEEMFHKIDAGVRVVTMVESSSHVCKGLWELRWESPLCAENI